jgi:hypothetical protein
MTVAKENYGFPREWREIYVDERVRTSSVMTDFHAHDYYELSIILSGDISVISGTATSVGTRPRVVLTRPNIPHIMTCNAGIEYRRVNVFFSEEFADTLPERDRLLLMFPIGGGVMELESEAALRIADAARRISDEPDSFRRLLLLAYLLSLIASERRIGADESIPDHVTAALNYVNSERQKGNEPSHADIAASYTKVIVDAIVKKTEWVIDKHSPDRLVLAGGVAANSHIRGALEGLCAKKKVGFCRPSMGLCSDNAAMVAAAGYFEYLAGNFADTSLNASAV